MFSKWNMVSYLDREEVDWKEAEKSFKVSVSEKWASSTKKNKFEYYCQVIRPYTKEEFSKMEGATQAYLTTPFTKL